MTVKTSMICLLNKDLEWMNRASNPKLDFFTHKIHEISIAKKKQTSQISSI